MNQNELNNMLVKAEEAYLKGEINKVISIIKKAANKYPNEANKGNENWNVKFTKKKTEEDHDHTVAIITSFAAPRSTLSSVVVFKMNHKSEIILTTGIAPNQTRIRNKLFYCFLTVIQVLALLPITNSTTQLFRIKKDLGINPHNLTLKSYGIIILKGKRYPIVRERDKIFMEDA